MYKRLIFALVVLAGSLPAVGQDYPRYRAVGSSFVPLDSWVYPVFERLAAQGYVQTAMFGLKPWTRFECARLTDEADDVMRKRLVEDRGVQESSAKMLASLQEEFAYELGLMEGRGHRSARLESAYARATTIAGPVLNDALHFGQTLSADFGRPYRRGTNLIAGGAARFEAGPLAVHLQAEYQHAPSAPALSQSVLNLMGQLANRTPSAPTPFAATNRPNVLDTYAGFNFRNWQITAGRQSLSWGPGAGESLLLSNNAQPMGMIRITRTVPMRMPGFLRRLGPVRNEVFVSRLVGHTDAPRPFIYAHKTGIKPHPRFELGYGRTTLIGGGNFPLTSRIFFRSFFGISPLGTSNPGDSRTTLDVSWLLPGLGDTTVFYADLFQDDSPVYFYNAHKAIVRLGFYVARLPGLPNWDFHGEGASSESIFNDGFGNRNYLNFQYRDGYVNRGFLMGNPIGRNGRHVQVWVRYWFSPRSTFEGRFKHSTVNPDFLPGGAAWEDYSVGHRFQSPSGLYVKNFLQVEHIRKFPALFPGVRSNVALAVEIGFAPGSKGPERGGPAPVSPN